MRLPWVAYEFPLTTGGFGSERVIFDVVAERGRKLYVVEVKDAVTSRDLGQVSGYIRTLQVAKVKATVLLGTDVLNYAVLLKGTIGEMVADMMERDRLGVLLADRYFVVVFDNYAQLTLREMPSFAFFE